MSKSTRLKTAAVKKSALLSLADWFERGKRVLPWRENPSIYRVWISEIMLQQTQVVAVIPYFERFMKRFPAVEALAAASEQDVLKLWEGLGYYSRARNILRAAQAMAKKNGGFPKTRDAWLEIPGVGPYTAGAIVSIALEKPAPILDGNVERVLSRFYRVGRGHGDSRYKQALWDLSEAWVKRAHGLGISPSVLNQGLMELGATLCSPRKPGCDLCPLRRDCLARKKSDAEAFPPRKKKKEWLEVSERLHCLVDSEGRVALRMRKKGEWRSGLWDFLEKAPSKARAALLGEVDTRHVVTRHKISRKTMVWKLRSAASSKTIDTGSGDTMRWIRIEETEVPVGSALVRTWREIRERFPEASPRN